MCFGVSTETNQWLVIGLSLAKVVAVAAYDTQKLVVSCSGLCSLPKA
jgi:hypothetical protein